MNQNDNINMYEGLASYFLPEGVLKYFEVTDFATQRTLDKDVLYTTELHIYLDERDNRTPDMKDSVSNGLGQDHVYLTIQPETRRRYFTYEEGVGQCRMAQQEVLTLTRSLN